MKRFPPCLPLWYAALMLWLSTFAPVPKMVLGRSMPQSVIFPGPGGTMSVAPSVTWAHVNGAAGPGACCTSATLSLGFTPSSGTLLLFACNGRSGHPTSISDNSSGPADSWTLVVPYFGSGAQDLTAWATVVTTGTAPTSIACSSSPGQSVEMVADNYSGGSASQDGTSATASGSSLTDTVSFTTGSTPGDLLWSVTELSGNQSGAMTVASPFTARSQSSDYNIMSSDDGVPSGIAASTSRTATYSLTGSAYSTAFIVGFNP